MADTNKIVGLGPLETIVNVAWPAGVFVIIKFIRGQHSLSPFLTKIEAHSPLTTKFVGLRFYTQNDPIPPLTNFADRWRLQVSGVTAGGSGKLFDLTWILTAATSANGLVIEGYLWDAKDVKKDDEDKDWGLKRKDNTPIEGTQDAKFRLDTFDTSESTPAVFTGKGTVLVKKTSLVFTPIPPVGEIDF